MLEADLNCGFARWMGFRGTVELPRAVLEGGDHATHRLVEQHLDHALQYPRLEFEIDKKIDAAAAWYRSKIQ